MSPGQLNVGGSVITINMYYFLRESQTCYSLPFSLSSLHNQEGYVWGQWKSILILDLRNVLLANITIIATQRLRDLIK